MKNFKDLTDAALIKEYRDGTDRAFNELWSRYEAKTKKRLIWERFDEDDVNDALQQTAMAAMNSIKQGKYKPIGTFGGWIGKIVRNKLMDIYEQKKKQVPTVRINNETQEMMDGLGGLCPMESEKQNREYHINGEERLRQFEEDIKKLPPQQRTIFEMRYFGKMTYKVIDEKLGLCSGSASSQFSKARKKLLDGLPEDKSFD